MSERDYFVLFASVCFGIAILSPIFIAILSPIYLQYESKKKMSNKIFAEKTEDPHVLSVKTISSIVGALVALLGSIWAVDSHYASAADVEKMQQNFTKEITQVRQEKMEDELFILDVKKQYQGGKLSPMEQAIHDRYNRRLQDMQLKQNKEAQK